MSIVSPPPHEPVTSAPPWATTEWFNSDPLALTDLSGRVIVLEAFQMLCPGCVSHGLPLAARLAQTFGDELAVIGLQTVFEHHEAMTPISLKAFLHEYRIGFPIGVDAHLGDDPTPVTFARYGMRGTPSMVLIDRDGYVRGHHFGVVDDMVVAAAVTRLLDVGPAVQPAEVAATPMSACVINGTCA
ncbi:MAG TPA: redoxin domain-containing protein [Nonomuraea sp.]|nr:redoxin domain-containing protein [Nonomuraea sp.]